MRKVRFRKVKTPAISYRPNLKREMTVIRGHLKLTLACPKMSPCLFFLHYLPAIAFFIFEMMSSYSDSSLSCSPIQGLYHFHTVRCKGTGNTWVARH